MPPPPTWRALPGETISGLLTSWQKIPWSWDVADVDRLLSALRWRAVRRTGRLLQLDTGLGVGGGYGCFLYHGGRIARLTVRVTDVVPAEQDRAAREFLLDAFAGATAAAESVLGPPTSCMPGDIAEVRWKLVPVTVRMEMIRVAVDLVLAETSYVTWQDESERVLAHLGAGSETAAPAPSVEMPAAQVPPAPAAPAPVQPSPAPAPPAPAPPAPSPPRRSRRTVPPAIMQKVIPHRLVGYYLDQGYDRIAGYVYKWDAVRMLDTPAKVFDALGLGYSGSPFARTDRAIHVIRWPAYAMPLYRAALGGNDEGQMQAVPGGWVVERPPFAGNGFAPSSQFTIPQMKVDSMRLPHRSEMWRIDADGTQEFVAAYDSDRWEWVRPPEEVQ